MDSNAVDEARYAHMRWNTPLSEDHAALLLQRLEIASSGSLLDLGCGWGELLLRAVAGARVDADGTGIDTNVQALERARALAAERGLAARVSFAEADAASWAVPADRVLCVGASHAWGGTEHALTALSRVVAPGGRLLFGDGCWERDPSPDAARMFEGEVLALEDILEQAGSAGWRVLHLSTADQREWDDFEATWRAGRQQWLLGHPQDGQAAHVRRELGDQLRQYVSVYRGVLGFCYLVLAR